MLYTLRGMLLNLRKSNKRKFFYRGSKSVVSSEYRDVDTLEVAMKKVELERLNSAWPRLYYETTANLVKAFSPRSILEIGVAYGWHADSLLNADKDVYYLGIDPYLDAYDSQDSFPRSVQELIGGLNCQESLDRLYEVVNLKLQKSSRARLFRMKSDDFFAKNEEKFELVFVDGNHKSSNCLSDIRNSWNLLEPGGILCGDDFNWPSVANAVDQFSKEVQSNYFLLENMESKHKMFVFFK